VIIEHKETNRPPSDEGGGTSVRVTEGEKYACI
jgi:hypothetical protein